MSPGNRNPLVRRLIAFTVFGGLTLASIGGGRVSDAGEEDPLTRMRVIRFQVRVLSETARKLEQKTQKKEAIHLLAQACKTGWKALQEIPADRFGEEDIVGPARSLAGEIDAGALFLLELLPDSGAASAEAGPARSPISRSEIYKGQIDTLDHIRGPVERRLEWRLGRLDEEGTLKEMASWFAECAEILDGLTDGEGAEAVYRGRLSDSLDNTLRKRREELSGLGNGADISGIVAYFCRGRPGEKGKGELRELLRSRFEALHPNFLKNSRSGGGKEPAAPATAEQIVFFYNLARVVRQALDPGEGGPIPEWRKTFEAYFRELAIVVKPLSEESTEGNTILTSHSGVNLVAPIPVENLRIRLLIGEEGRAPTLPSLSELGLEKYFLPPGSYIYILEVDGEGGSLGTIFTSPAGVSRFEVTLPSYLPADRVFIPTIGYHVDGWVFGNKPLTKREFAKVIYDEKEEEGGGRFQPLGRGLWNLYMSVIGTEPEERMRKPENLKATQQKISGGEETVFLDAAQGKSFHELFSSSLAKVGGFSLAPAVQADLLSRYLQLTSSPGGEELKDDSVHILATGLGEPQPGEKRRYLLFLASQVVFSK